MEEYLSKKKEEIEHLEAKLQNKKEHVENIKRNQKENQETIEFLTDRIEEIRQTAIDYENAKYQCQKERNRLVLTGAAVLAGTLTMYAALDYTMMYSMALVAASGYTLIAIPRYLVATKDERKIINENHKKNFIDECRLKFIISANEHKQEELNERLTEVLAEQEEIKEELQYKYLEVAHIEADLSESIIGSLDGKELFEEARVRTRELK